MTKFETLQSMITNYLEANKSELIGFMFMNKVQKQALIAFINENWDDLRKEQPKYFWERKEKTTNLAKSGDKVLQEVITTRMAMETFVSCPFDDIRCEAVQETKSFEPIPEMV